MPAIIQKAASKSFNLAYNASILTSETTDLLLAKAYAQMLALAAAAAEVNAEAVDDELRINCLQGQQHPPLKRKRKRLKKKLKMKKKRKKRMQPLVSAHSSDKRFTGIVNLKIKI